MPAFYRTSVRIKEAGDTFLDMRKWTKGVVWVNGHNLGRYWNIGPQQTLYCPGPWLKKGENEIIVLELVGTQNPKIEGLPEPILHELNYYASGKLRRKAETVDFSKAAPIQEGSFPPGSRWQTTQFSPAKGRYVALEALNSQSDDSFTTVAELNILGLDGKPLSGDLWQVAYCDSEEIAGEDGSAANAFDDDVKTFWHTRWAQSLPKQPHPHRLVIDLGKEETLTGLQYLPRQDKNNGRIRDYRIFVSRTPFPGL